MRGNLAGQAKTLLSHYFRQASKGPWDYNSDNQAEIEETVDLIIEAATKSLEEKIEQLEARISSLETSNLKRINGEEIY